MPALDGKAHLKLGADLWEKLNAQIDRYETENGGKPMTTEADVAAVLTATFAERTNDNAAQYDEATQCLLTMIKRAHTPVSEKAKELLVADKRRDDENKRVGDNTQELILKRELAILITKSQGDFMIPAEYYANEEHMALKKKQIHSTFPSGRAQAIIDEATREGLAAASP